MPKDTEETVEETTEAGEKAPRRRSSSGARRRSNSQLGAQARGQEPRPQGPEQRPEQGPEQRPEQGPLEEGPPAPERELQDQAEAGQGVGPGPAQAPLPRASQDIQALTPAVQAQAVLALLAEGRTPRNALLGLVEQLADPAKHFLAELSGSPEGLALIDDIMRAAQGFSKYLLYLPKTVNVLTLGIGGLLLGAVHRTAGGARMNTFAGLAITQVFGVELDISKWSKDALHHMYFMFRKVPRSHVQGAVTKMERTGGGDSSFNKQEKSIKMAYLPTSVHMGASERAIRGASLGVFSIGVGGKFLMKRSPYSQRMRGKNAFKMTALHEIGHAVEHKLTLMSRQGHQEGFGGWEDLNSNEALKKSLFAHCDVQVAEEAQPEQYREAKRDYAAAHERHQQAQDDVSITKAQYDADPIKSNQGAWTRAKDRVEGLRESVREGEQAMEQTEMATPTLRKIDLRAAIDLLLAGGKIKTLMEREPFRGKPQAERNRIAAALRAHPIVQMIKAGKKTGAWARERGTLAVDAQHFGGRVYHLAYEPDHWASFLVAQKADGVSHYQWRSQSEWFAELYAHYYMGTLGGHPKEVWFRETIDREIANQPAQAGGGGVPQGEPPGEGQEQAQGEQAQGEQAQGEQAQGEQAGPPQARASLPGDGQGQAMGAQEPPAPPPPAVPGVPGPPGGEEGAGGGLEEALAMGAGERPAEPPVTT